MLYPMNFQTSCSVSDGWLNKLASLVSVIKSKALEDMDSFTYLKRYEQISTFRAKALSS